ncbi:GNAT family N-acetyltransferase [Loigolactobacillus bifermentans]|uniref:Acetyltransferase n=1 Tax=Loigolactobacillus bifermentans DSM 20003 TaxID=1423726 RepID=A0A0R1GYZ8_9LACO|nr:GNAT family N-acetyltransferase [Loigolactobacillus bifermentans]KRK39429.1 acetyltransferase [Loigolactobacillus bifermentans DSM 20003]QGG61197.1 GNAT family N-acetyltransferase [Loigolactobacillus bifermentans]
MLEIKTTAELTPAALITIMQARVAVFVVEQNCPYQEVDAKDTTATHVMLWHGTELVAYTRIIPHDDGQHISFGRVLVAQAFRGQQYGRQIVAATIDAITQRYPDQAIKIQAQDYLRDFYGSFGFKPVSETYLEDGIPHVDMVQVKKA